MLANSVETSSNLCGHFRLPRVEPTTNAPQ